MASTCYCVKRPGLCGDPDYCTICPIDPDEPKTLVFTYEDGAYDSYPAWQQVIPTAKDTQVGGSHYAKNSIQPIDYIIENNLGWCEANAVKYLTRWKAKNGVEDLRKAKHYIELLIERVEKENAA
jgi:hypothetical protein